jgi:hypothetical protein
MHLVIVFLSIQQPAYIFKTLMLDSGSKCRTMRLPTRAGAETQFGPFGSSKSLSMSSLCSRHGYREVF